MMKSSKKVKDLEKEVQELRYKIASLEEGLKTAETFINSIKNNGNPGLVVPNVVITEPNDKNNNSEVSITVLKDESPLPPDNTNNLEQQQNIHPSENNKHPSENNRQPSENNNQSTVDNASSNKNNTTENKSKKKENSSAESWIGKILMGALASLLVFIALITFAKVLLPYLTDTMKIILMFVASFVLTGTGFFFTRRKPENTFYMALLACGSACIYLSVMMTGIYFKAISPIVMYVLIGVWAIFILFLKKDKFDWLFFVIGNLGYIASVIFTIRSKDKSLIIPVLIYILMINMVYQAIYWKNIYQRYTQNIINVMTLILFQIIITLYNIGSKEAIIVGVVAAAYSFIVFMSYPVFDFFHYSEKYFIIAVLNIGAYLVEYCFLRMNLNINYDHRIILSFVVFIIPAVVLEFNNMYWRSKNRKDVESILNLTISGILFYVATLILAIGNRFLYTSGIIVVIYSLIVMYGIIKKDQSFKIQGWCLVFLCIMGSLFLKASLSFTIIAFILILASLIVEGIVLNNSVFFKIASYILMMIWIIRISCQISNLETYTIDDKILIVITYGIMSVLNSVMIMTKFYKTKKNESTDCKKDENRIRFMLDVFNLIFILAGVILTTISNKIIYEIIYMVFMYALACVNLPIRGKESNGRYFYAGIKFALLIYFSLHKYKTPNLVISICMIAFSVVCVALGFMNRLIGKELRIFGLVMTLVFVVKFIILDISYDSSILKALSYLISGVLCFGISFIYNYFEKKGKQTSANEN